jgi:hypothetical protein
MSSSVVIKGIRDDEEYKHMLAVYRTCQDANVPVPDAVNDFFGWSEPNGGRSVAVPSTYFKDDRLTNNYIERFRSYSKINNQMRAIGVIRDDDYITDNPYGIRFDSSIIGFDVNGLTSEQIRVRYYNLLNDKRNNKNVPGTRL